MCDFEDALNAKAERCREAEQAADAHKAWDEWLAAEERKRKRRQQDAAISTGARAVLAIVVAALLCVAADLDLMHAALAGGLLMLDVGWIAFWVGAWWQFRYAKEGRMYGAE